MTLHKIKMITKPFWIPLISVIYITAADKTDPLVIAALLFGYAGDLLLMRSRKSWFVAGTLSFLVGHIFYIIVFIKSAGGIEVFTNRPAAGILCLLPYILYLALVKKVMGHNVSSVFIVAAVYLSVVALMSYSALLRVWNMPFRDFFLTFSGSILFLISDSLIGVRNFKRKFRGIGTVIVVTYIAAQLLIIAGLV